MRWHARSKAPRPTRCCLSIQLAFPADRSDGCHHRNGGKERTMATFTIDSENNITGYAPDEAVPDGNTERFTTEDELG